MEEAKKSHKGAWAAVGTIASAGLVYLATQVSGKPHVPEELPSNAPVGFGYLDTRITRVKEYAERMDTKQDAAIQEAKQEAKSVRIEIKEELKGVNARLDQTNADIKEILWRLPKKGDLSKNH
jgi:esterase/lipase